MRMHTGRLAKTVLSCPSYQPVHKFHAVPVNINSYTHSPSNFVLFCWDMVSHCLALAGLGLLYSSVSLQSSSLCLRMWSGLCATTASFKLHLDAFSTEDITITHTVASGTGTHREKREVLIHLKGVHDTCSAYICPALSRTHSRSYPTSHTGLY